MPRKFFNFVVLLLSLALVLAACGGQDTSAPADPGADADEQEETAEEPRGEQTLIFARGGDSVSLDFASVTDGESSRVTKQIFETLVEFEPDSFEVKPGLAHDWDISEDGLSYTFYLRQGVKFHDGTDFNADAVIFNFERWSDPDHPYHFAEEGFDYSVYGSLFGGFKGDEGHVIEEIVKHDDYTVEFKLKRPMAAFIQNLGANYFAIASPASFEEYGPQITENPVGTGPFVFKEWRKNDTIILEKNPDYWQEGLPKLDRIIFKVIPDNSARFTALRAGEIDIMDGLNPDDVPVVESDPNLQLFERAPNNVGYLGFNVQKPPFDNPKVRRALNHAVNKEALIAGLYNNLAIPAKNPVPPGYLGYHDGIEEYEYNPELAKQLLAEAGYPDGFEFDLWTMPVARPYMPDPEKAAEALQEDFRKVGLTANIVTKEWATYLEETQEGKQDVFMLGWSGVNGDPDYFLYNLLSGYAIPGGNRTFYDNPEVNELLVQAQNILDPDERAAVYRKAQEIIHEDAPWIPLVHNTPVLAGRSHVKNYVPHPSTSESLMYVELE
ncbi:ABC transporter substrate-binding protein [Caldalkalibacillus thermarum]|uniref:ABC transporter substrate-binding protein n=1 Tax=Caldalkalibacillus thermarum TaxID=296745 RepID=UPI0016686B7B|nr:ABC transporter substrate-binding protein [Caldalkalibacillus thermarum]GGK30529.1 ABC transporter substrate-binding protein [Caldalkalibacillus thermarum]